MLQFLAYLLIGIIAGTLSGLLGIGGGLIVVPALVFVFTLQQMPPDIIMHMAAGTSLAAMIITAFSAIFTHLRHGIEIWPIYRRIVISVIIGTIIGAILASILHTHILEILFGIMTLIVATLILSGVQPAAQRKLPGRFGLNTLGLVVGSTSGLLGLGGGVISIPLLSYYNVPLRNVIGISIGISATVSIVGTISFMLTGSHVENLPTFSTGYIYWPAVLGIAIISPIFAMLGAMWSHRLPVTILRKVFAVFLLFVGIRMLV